MKYFQAIKERTYLAVMKLIHASYLSSFYTNVFCDYSTFHGCSPRSRLRRRDPASFLHDQTINYVRLADHLRHLGQVKIKKKVERATNLANFVQKERKCHDHGMVITLSCS